MLLPVEKWQLQHSRQVQPNKNEENASDLAQLELVCTQETPQRAGCRSQGYKGERKAKHEHHRVQKGHETRWTMVLFPWSLIDALACQLGKIDGNQR